MAACCLFSAWGCHAEQGIFAAGDEPDVIHLTDQAQGKAPILIVQITGNPSDRVPLQRVRPPTHGHADMRLSRNDPTIDAAIGAASKQHHISAALIRAVLATESAYRRQAVSPRGASGLMQLMPETAREMGVADVFDVAQNIDGGTRYLRLLLDRFNGDLSLALAAYNAGAGAVERHGFQIPPFAETLAYVPRVLRQFHASSATPNDDRSELP